MLAAGCEVVNPASPSPTVLANVGSEVSYVEFDEQNKVLYAAAYTQGQILTVSSSGENGMLSDEPDDPRTRDNARMTTAVSNGSERDET